MRPMYVAGWGFWSPGYVDAAAWHAGTADPAELVPAPSLLPRRTHARASLLTKMLCGVGAEACRAAGVLPGEVPTIYASALGETGRLLELLATPLDEQLSPLRFQLSVHNAAAGLASIASGNRGFTTSLSAGADTLCASLWEAAAWLAEHAGEVLLAVGDEGGPVALGSAGYAPLATALVLSAEHRPGRLRCSVPSPDPPGSGTDAYVDAWDSAALAPLRYSPSRAGALLVRALASSQAGRVPLGGPGGQAMSVSLEPSKA